MKRILVVMATLLLILFAFPTTVMAGGMYEGKVVFGTDYTLESGEELNGDLLVFGGNVTLEINSRVIGDAVIFGGNVIARGEITGDLAVLGGSVDLGSQSVVKGNVVLLGGDLDKAEGARIEGDTVSENEFNVPMDFEWVGPDFNWKGFSPASTLTRGLWYLFRSFMMAALAVLVVMFVPTPTKRVSQAIIEQPLLAGGLGLLSAFLTPVVLLAMVLLIVTILGIPLVFMALVTAVVFGWVAIGLEVGERLGDSLNWDLHPAAAAGLGTFLFSIVTWGIGFIPCIGWVAPAIMYCVAFGGILLSRFGTQSYTFTPRSVPAIEDVGEDSTEAEEAEGA
jgi:cytoskeletal protein CcmA (bactofilin family)